MEEDTKKNQPNISIFIGLSLIIIFILYASKLVQQISCGDEIHQIFIRNFVHVDAYHLFINLFALYALSMVEKEMGFHSFLWLMIFLIVSNTFIEYIVKKFKM